MKNFLRIAQGVDVTPLLLSLQQMPYLWNATPLRKVAQGTPHAAMEDIWLRFAAQPVDFDRPHFPIWYPPSEMLPVKQIIYSMMTRAEATHLGGVLITRIPPGGRIEPHADHGWHPEFYNCKFYLPLATNDRCVFRVENEKVVMQTGDIWWLNNTVEHEVTNDGDTERITLIVCMRKE